MKEWRKNTAREENPDLRGRFCIPEDEIPEMDAIFSRELLRAKERPRPPAMPLIKVEGEKSLTANSSSDLIAGGSSKPTESVHNEKFTRSGSTSYDSYVMVHAPIKSDKAMQIPEAKAAIQKEWDKLHMKRTWLIETVQELDDVKNKAAKEKRKVHFGTLMPLCHQKNSELSE